MNKLFYYHGTTKKLRPGIDLLYPTYNPVTNSNLLFTTTDFSAALGYALARNNNRYTFMWEPKTRTLIVDPKVTWGKNKCAYVYTVSPHTLKKYIPAPPSFFTACSNYYISNVPAKILTVHAVITPQYLKENNISLYVAKKPHLTDRLYNTFECQLKNIFNKNPKLSVNPEDANSILDVYKETIDQNNFLETITSSDFLKII